MQHGTSTVGAAHQLASARQPRAPTGPAGTPFWRLVLKQFDDLLVKVGAEWQVLWQKVLSAG